VVTEYGVAYLHGKSVEERAIALIAIAHPDFRARLLKEAVDARYMHPEFARVEGKLVVGPTELRTTRLLGDGTQVTFRPIHPTDEPRITDLFYALSQETIYYRYMSRSKTVPRSEIQDFVFIDHRSELAIVCTVPEAHGEDIIAVGRYYLDEKTNMAEVAFVVRDDWQNKGIGTELLRYLTQIAIRNGIRGFTAEVLRANRAMQRVFHKVDYKVTSQPQDDVYSFVIEFQ
jgi:RimJ/RimL family protein N-acetyltransferase